MPLIDTPPDAAARVYARSLFDLALGKGGQAVIEDTVGELEDILDLARSDARFGEFLSSPAISGADRARALDKIFKGRVSDLTLRFLHVLNEKGRIAYLPSIASAFDQQTQERFGRIVGEWAVPVTVLGRVGRDRLTIRVGESLPVDLPVDALADAFEGGLARSLGESMEVPSGRDPEGRP